MNFFDKSDPSTWDYTNINQFIVNAIHLALLLASGVAVIYIIIGSYSYFTAYGNEKQAETAKKTILYALVGVAIILLSWVFTNEVWGLFTTNPSSLPPIN